MAREALIGTNTRNFFLRGRPLSLGGGNVANVSPLPLPIELAFQRREIPGRSYKDIVDQALKTAAPGSYAYNQLLKEQSQAIQRIRDEEEKAISEGRKLRKLQALYQASTTQGKTAQDALNLYNFWYNEAIQASNEGDAEYAYQSLINANSAREQAESRSRTGSSKYLKEVGKNLADGWKTEDKEFEDNIKKIKQMYRQGKISKVSINGKKVDEMSLLLKAQYDAWQSQIDYRIAVLDQNPELAEKMPSGYDQEGLKTRLESDLIKKDGEEKGLVELNQKVTANLSTAPGLLVPIADYKNGTVRQEIAPVNLKTGYVQDEYGIYHKVDFVTGPEGSQAVINVLKPDGSIQRIVSDSKSFDPNTFDPNTIDLFLEGSKTPIVRLGEIDQRLQGRLALTDADVSSEEYLRDVLDIPEEEIPTLRSDFAFKQLEKKSPEFAAIADRFRPEKVKETKGLLQQTQESQFAPGYQLVDESLSRLGNLQSTYEKLRNEGLLEQNYQKLADADKALKAFEQQLKTAQAEIGLTRPLPIIKNIQDLPAVTPSPAPGKAPLPQIVLQQPQLGQPIQQSIRPSTPQAPINLPASAANILNPPRQTSPSIVDQAKNLIKKIPIIGKWF